MIMCGIVGLLVKKPGMRDQLGELMVPMLLGMTERGPDSAGLAVFTEPLQGKLRKYSVYSGLIDGAAQYDWNSLVMGLMQRANTDVSIVVKGNHAVDRKSVV